MKLLKQIILLSGVWLFFSCPIYAQNTVLQNEQKQVLTLPAIVEMPEIPEEIKDINERYVYFTRHFWDKFNFKQKSVGQIQLDDAFGQYCVGLRLIPAKVAYSEVDALLKKLNKNPTLLYQFCISAENNLYDPNRAEVLIDDIYVRFLEEVMKCKKLSENRKSRFEFQYAPLHQSLVGQLTSKFEFIDRNAGKMYFTPKADKTLILFGHPDCGDCMMARIKLEMDSEIAQKCKNGEIEIYYIIPDAENDNWLSMVEDYSQYWTVGMADGIDRVYDIRFLPTIYAIDSNRKISIKTPLIDEAIKWLKSVNE